MIEPVTDAELLEALTGGVDGRKVAGLTRRPYRYATSAPLERVRVALEDGDELDLILKHLAGERMPGGAQAGKPEFLNDPMRELETYRRLLDPAGIGPRYLAGVARREPAAHWLLIEKVPGVELWQIGELEIWERAASWIGALHARWTDRADELRALNPHLIDHSASWFEAWSRRAVAALERSADPRASTLAASLERYGEVAEGLAGLPRTFVHGELYPANVLVVTTERPPGIYPVDWEMAAIGPGLIDLAALAAGYGPEERERLETAYVRGVVEAGGPSPDPEELTVGLARCRLHLAIQWLGWGEDWRPPPEHSHDWLDEARDLTESLGLGERA
jgi:hypothetical protein